VSGEITGYRGHVATFVAAVAFAIGAFVFFLGLGGGLPSTHDSYRVNALLPGSGSLTAGARVTMAGAKVGKVVSVRRQGPLGARVDAARRQAGDADPARTRASGCASARRWARTTSR